MSTVYLSYDVAAGRSVAVKVLADHLATSREFVNRFYREARLSRLLAHQNLVRGLAAGYDPDARKHYLVLEFIDGPTAHTALVRHGPFPVGIAVKAGIDIARALDFLHSRNYVHRDVKPDNVLLHPDGVAKLADLGLAKRLNDDAHLTSVNLGLGTSYYMAYEQSLNADLVDGRSDIFALGATLYHLLTGTVPFPGATHEEISRGKQRDSFVPIQELNPRVPAKLTEIVARTLACDPTERYQSAGELAEALEATGLGTPITALGVETHQEVPIPDVPTRTDLNQPDTNGRVTPTIHPPVAPYAVTPTPVTDGFHSTPKKWRNVRKHAMIALAFVASMALTAIAVGALVTPAPKDQDAPNPHRPFMRELPDPNPDSGGLSHPLPR